MSQKSPESRIRSLNGYIDKNNYNNFKSRKANRGVLKYIVTDEHLFRYNFAATGHKFQKKELVLVETFGELSCLYSPKVLCNN